MEMEKQLPSMWGRAPGVDVSDTMSMLTMPRRGTLTAICTITGLTNMGGVETPFKFEIIGFFKTPLERQVAEAVRLQRTGAVKILNSKSVYSRSSIP